MHIENGDLIDVVKHSNNKKYANQKILVIDGRSYIYIVPFIENEVYHIRH